ncbi:MAG: DUF1761 domain-containing protein [Candidatus Saccharimonadales bacterium]
MNVVEINWLAVLLATASAMVVGMIWYAKPVFGTIWMHLAGLSQERMRKNVVWPMVSAVLGSLATAYILAHVAFMAHAFFDQSFLADALTTAFWLWFGLSLTTLIIHNSFEQKPWKLTWLAAGNRFVTIMIMGLIIGLLKP